jgi:CBS domain-containing protein/sporulation protein YlmC with PRC-barrel domain
MLYFSELKGKRIRTESGVTLGRLIDLVFLAQTQPAVTKLVTGTPNKPIIIPLSYLTKLNTKITISDSFSPTALSGGELYVNKNVLDQQIIDIKGNKVVRVNDVALQEKPILMIAGVDIGIVGLLRWFGLDETFGKLFRLLGLTITSRFLSWADIQPLALSRGKVVLRKEEGKLAQLRPEDLADHLENMGLRNVTRIIALLDDARAARVIESLNVSYQQNLFKQFAAERSAKIIECMDPDDAVDVLLTFSLRRREHVMSHLSQARQQDLKELLHLSTTPIGGLITSEFFTAHPEETVLTIRHRIRTETAAFSSLPYVYAVNKQHHLVGVISLHELILQQNDVPLYKCMTPSVVVLHLTTPLEIAVKRMFKYKVEALPVIGPDKELLGIVTIDDLAETILRKL